MTNTALTLLPFLIADIVNPVLFAFMVYAAGVNRPVITSSAVLLGHTLAYFSLGIIATSGLEKVESYLYNPQSVDYVLGSVIGALLLWVALLHNKKDEKKKEDSIRIVIPELCEKSEPGMEGLL